MQYLLSKLNDKDDLLEYIGISENQYDKVIKFIPESDTVTLSTDGISKIDIPAFLKHQIPKKRGKGFRTAWQATYTAYEYKALARRLDICFRNSMDGFPHKSSFGFISSKNIRDNAIPHCGKKHIIKTDIEGFFSSITTEIIIEMLKSIGANDEISVRLAEFLTIDGKLAEGLPTSPIISNAVCHQMDFELTKLASNKNANYTRYADDITMSSDIEQNFLDEIKSVLNKYSFKMASKKTRITKIGQAHFVTGLSVSDSKQPHVPKRIKRNLRQQLYYSYKFGLIEHFEKMGISDDFRQSEINRLDGLIRYVSFIEPQLSHKLKSKWQYILIKSGQSISYDSQRTDVSVNCQFLIDETQFEINGINYLAVSICTTFQGHVIEQTIRNTLNRYLASPFSDGDIQKIERNGLHFSDATVNLRQKFIIDMQTLQFQGYIIFAHLKSTEHYSETYLNLLSALLKRRLVSADGYNVQFAIEQNNKISQNDIKSRINNAFEELKIINSRRPSNIEITIVSKKCSLITLPDFLLGTFRRYLLNISKKENISTSTPLDILLFERLRDKCRVILNYDTGKEYTRHKQLDKNSYHPPTSPR